MRDSESDEPTLSLSDISKRIGAGRDKSVTTIARMLLLELGVDKTAIENALQDYMKGRGDIINPPIRVSESTFKVINTICRATGIPNTAIFIEACLLAGIVTFGFSPSNQTED